MDGQAGSHQSGGYSLLSLITSSSPRSSTCNVQEPNTRRPIIPTPRPNPLAVAATLPACSLYPLQGSLMLLDAHLVFQPFLAALGVSPNQITQGKRSA